MESIADSLLTERLATILSSLVRSLIQLLVEAKQRSRFCVILKGWFTAGKCWLF